MDKKGQPLGLSWWVWLILLILLLILIAGFYSGLFNQAESQAGQALGAKSTKANVCAGIGGATETGFCYTFSYIEETNEYINCEDRTVMLDLVSRGAEIKHECNLALVRGAATKLCRDVKMVKQKERDDIRVGGRVKRTCENWIEIEQDLGVVSKENPEEGDYLIKCVEKSNGIEDEGLVSARVAESNDEAEDIFREVMGYSKSEYDCTSITVTVRTSYVFRWLVACDKKIGGDPQIGSIKITDYSSQDAIDKYLEEHTLSDKDYVCGSREFGDFIGGINLWGGNASMESLGGENIFLFPDLREVPNTLETRDGKLLIPERIESVAMCSKYTYPDEDFFDDATLVGYYSTKGYKEGNYGWWEDKIKELRRKKNLGDKYVCVHIYRQST